MTDIKAAMTARTRKLAEAAERGVKAEEIVVQHKESTSVPPVSTLVDDIAHKVVQEHNKSEVQVLTIENYQWYGIELAKAVSMNENRWLVDWIFEDGQVRHYEPFTIRPVRTHNEGYKLVYERPTVKSNGKLHKWFIPWKHNVECPGFITYSTLPFYHDGLYYRLIDIDFGENGEHDQIWNYCDWEEYKHFHDLLCGLNLQARRMEKTHVQDFQRLLQKAADNIMLKLKVRDVWFTGGGFRVLVKEPSMAELNDRIISLKAQHLVCTSSTVGYQAQKLFSVQTIKPHFQTEISPFSSMFRYSNPGFFVVKYTKELLEELISYYATYLRRTYFDLKPPDEELSEREIYARMSEEQKCLEKKILGRLSQTA